MKLFLKYLFYRRRVFLLVLLLTAQTALLGWLWGIPAEDSMYVFLTSGVICLIVLGVDFGRFVDKHARLQRAKNQILIKPNALPEPESQLDADYHEIIETLSRELDRATVASDRRYGELADYFTLWAHEIKTPISAMGLILQQEQTGNSAELGDELSRIEQCVDTALSYMRLESDYTDFILRSYQLDGIIKQAIRKLSRQFISRRISLEYAGTNKTTVTDEKWLVFVIEQILTNALKYTPPGGRISIIQSGDSLSIADTGEGIAPEELPRVFEKSFTGSVGRRDKRATGIGLYLCKSVLNKLGCEIAVASTLGEGTTVTISGLE